MSSNRRDFIKKVTAGTAGMAATGSVLGMSAKSYRQIIGANERLNVAIMGLGRRYGAYIPAIARKESNVKLAYLCDVKESQREDAAQNFAKHIDYKPELENDIRKVIDDPKVDALFISTPDHWHTPGSIMAMKGGKHVYVEKPCSHDMNENEMLVAAAKKYNKVIQMGNQSRSSLHDLEIIREIHNGVIGTPYKAIAFYKNDRGVVPLQKKAPVPNGLDWNLFQGPAPHREYTSETWNYNWHWYGWDYGTAEAGNNAIHELDVARWALGVNLPQRVDVEAAKRHFLDDGWEMYDTMYASFRFDGNKIIAWDGKSRNAYNTYGTGRGVVVYGSNGSVFIDRGRHILYDRGGNKIKYQERSDPNDDGTALGGGGNLDTAHVVNFFDGVRGKVKLNSPIDDAAISMTMVHYMNIAYRIGRGFDIDDASGRMFDRDAMKLWSRSYEPGWEPTL